jgi:hypothetical protein
VGQAITLLTLKVDERRHYRIIIYMKKGLDLSAIYLMRKGEGRGWLEAGLGVARIGSWWGVGRGRWG